MKRIVGLIVNPVAGMGGSVGLKGTDGEIYKRALELGAKPVTPKRTDEVLSNIKKKNCIKLVVAPGKMGERHTSACDIPFKVIGTVGEDTSKEDTKRISKEMVSKGAELLVFVGGDGTARDIYDAIRSAIPVVAVPAGVKVFSSVFAVSARAAAEMVESIVENTATLLVVDEAYYEFSKVTFVDMVHDHPNLAITRTMDKGFSLAGARIGYMVAGEAFIEAFSSFYMLLPRASLFAAIAALQNPAYMRRNVGRVMAEKERVWKSLNEFAMDVYPSTTNFLLAKADIPDLVPKLDDMGIQIVDLSNQLAPGFIRVSIGTCDENEAFVKGYLKIRSG